MEHYRSSQHFAIRLTCPCRLSDGLPVALEIQDISSRGCTARLGELPLFSGQSLTLYPEGMELPASVRSIYEDRVVIEFDRELPSSMFEQLRCNFVDGLASPVTAPDPASPAVQAEPAAAPEEAAPRAEYGSLSAIDTSRRGKRAFGSKPVLLR